MSRSSKTLLATQLCRLDRGHVVTDSTIVGRRMGKDNKAVMRLIRRIFATTEDPVAGALSAPADLLSPEEIGSSLSRSTSLNDSAPECLDTVEIDGAFMVVEGGLAGALSAPAKIRKLGGKENVNDAFREKTRADKRAFVHRNFLLSSYKDEQKKARPMYVMTEAGFRLLMRSYDGDLADAIFLDFESAFEYWRNRGVAERAMHLSIGWQETRDYTKGMRKELGEAIDRHVKRAFEMGSKNAKRYFETITLLIHSNLFRTDDEEYGDLRDRLVPAQLVALATVETAAAKSLNEAIDADLPYKGPGGCYEAVQKRVLMLCSALGRSYVPPQLPQALALDFGPSALPERNAA